MDGAYGGDGGIRFSPAGSVRPGSEGPLDLHSLPALRIPPSLIMKRSLPPKGDRLRFGGDGGIRTHVPVKAN